MCALLQRPALVDALQALAEGVLVVAGAPVQRELAAAVVVGAVSITLLLQPPEAQGGWGSAGSTCSSSSGGGIRGIVHICHQLLEQNPQMLTAELRELLTWPTCPGNPQVLASLAEAQGSGAKPRRLSCVGYQPCIFSAHRAWF